ncbi:alpha/beta fold hydrolase [Saccharibacillus deserti]|uniref:alpha/beta fold hydrolase n=1 Tax=Saccharibacillus deserti TaxID=1634444 RepID=UPI001555D2DA|nr:alpha/beta fold hydrolase [Saccharibacillus deserti]
MAYRLEQLNRSGIPPLLAGIESLEQWKDKLAGIRTTWLTYIGGLPAGVPVRTDSYSRSEHTGYTRYGIRYDTVYADEVTAYLLVPHEPKFKHLPGGGYPAVLALHPTIGQGKDDIALASGRPNRRYAVELAQRGYVVLAPDALTAGERIYPGKAAFDSGPFDERYLHWSTVAKNIADHRQAIDVLSSLKDVNPEAIGAIGHSFGAYNAYFLAGMDNRVRAVIASCGFSPFTGDRNPEHWSYRSYPYTHIPNLSADLKRGEVPFDFHEIIALSAPTPFFGYSGQNDKIFPHWEAIGGGYLELKKLYGWLGEEESFQSYIGTGAHDFPEDIRRLAYAFLDRWLANE